jgi:Na+/proline symporter
MHASLVIGALLAYFALLILISFLTGRKDDNATFFIGNRRSPWYVVAFGMIGASLSGVTFISVPGWVETSQFSYMQIVLGYLVGYLVIGTVLLPLYYRLNLTSIYGYLEGRFGRSAYKTGSVFFLISRTIGASFRLYLVAGVLQIAIFNELGTPYWLTVVVTIGLIWLYTFRSGIRTIIWTDTLQTAFMLIAVILSIYFIAQHFEYGLNELVAAVKQDPLSQIFFFDDPNDLKFFPRQFLAGAFIAIVMTGLDQDMMQKNLSCRSLEESQKNMFWFSTSLVFVNLIFLVLGLLLLQYARATGIEASGDDLFPVVALQGGLGWLVGLTFFIGLIAAAYSSADSALTSLTTSFCVDILDFEKKDREGEKRLRKSVHLGFSVLLVAVILVFEQISNDSVISELFKVAGYTYGPLLGLYAFGLFTRWSTRDKFIPIVAILSPVLSYLLNWSLKRSLDFEFGFELLIINGLITFIGLLMLSKKQDEKIPE